jgi:cytochrome c
MVRSVRCSVAVVAAALVLAPPAHAQDHAAGKQSFNKCRACHSLEEGRNTIGPSLYGVFGRKAGTVPKFSYTEANRDSGIVWTDETLFAYLKAPQKAIPGTKMIFPGIKRETERRDLIAFLKQATRPK